jgi:zinc protease
MSLDRTQAPAPTAVREFDLPVVGRSTLPNGVTLLHAQRGDLPLVTISVLVDAGAATERAGEEGLAWLTAHALEGGTARRSGEDLAWELERLGAQLETRTGWDALNVAITTRSDRLTEALELLAEIVRTPAFPVREVERLRNEQLAEIIRRTTDPRSLADDAAARLIFADDATYARPVLGLEDHIRGFGRDHVTAFHARRFTPRAAAIVIVGAVEHDAAARAATHAFGDWSGERQQEAPPSVAPRSDTSTIYVVDRPSAVQSELRMGHPGVPRHHPDYYALLLANTILGGAFTSRLNLNLREKHGFTYGVRSSFAFRRAAGPFIIQTAVASDVTARAVEESMRELRGLRDNGVTDDELRNARDFLAGTLPLGMQTTEDLAARIAELHTYDLGDDWFVRYRPNLDAVSRGDALRAAREHLHPERMAIVVVGSADAVSSDLAALGLGPVLRQDAAAGTDTATTADTSDTAPAAS